jgi:methylphosphotriester-DNA--protein-cysteine methyltransferase
LVEIANFAAVPSMFNISALDVLMFYFAAKQSISLYSKNALRLLKETEANVAMISESVGYSDTQYFYRIFKKEKGVTAIEYRKQYIE